jgi:hypothetical protein
MTTQADILTLSDERDLWLRRLLNSERAAYVAGYADGRADERVEADRAWAAQPLQRVSDRAELAELEQLRWGPGGREHFGAPRPGDYPGQEAPAA